MVFVVGKGTTRNSLMKISNTLHCMWYGSEKCKKEPRPQSLELSISLLKNFKKDNNSNLPDPSGPLERSAPSSLPTRTLAASPACKHRNDDPFTFGIEVYQQLQLPKCPCTLGSLVSWFQLQRKWPFS